MLQKTRTPTAGVANLFHNIRQFFQIRYSLPMRHTIGYLVMMLFHIISDFPGNDVKCKRNIW